MNKPLLILTLLVGIGGIAVIASRYDSGKGTRTSQNPVAPESSPHAGEGVGTQAGPDQAARSVEEGESAESDEIDEEEADVGEGAAAEDPIWADYVDPDGFSLRYPKLIYVADECADPNEGVFRDVGIPTEIFKDERSLYFAASYAASRAGGKCVKAVTTVESIRSFFRGEGGFIGWRVTVVPVADKDEVESAVRTNVEDTCRVGKLIYRQATDDFSVDLVGAGDEDCQPGSERHLVYSEGHGKLAILEGAQDCVFADDRYHKGSGASAPPEGFYEEHCLDGAFVKSLRWGPGS